MEYSTTSRRECTGEAEIVLFLSSKCHKVARSINRKLQQIKERKLSLASTNNGFMYQDTAPSNYWKIHGIEWATEDYFSDYLETFLNISSMGLFIDGVCLKNICLFVYMIRQIICVLEEGGWLVGMRQEYVQFAAFPLCGRGSKAVWGKGLA